MTISLNCFTDGWRACLREVGGDVRDTTVDVYLTPEVLIARIFESKTWFEDLDENRTPLAAQLFHASEPVIHIPADKQVSPPWVDVREGLPERGTNFLAWFPGGMCGEAGGYSCGEHTLNGVWVIQRAGMWTHWQLFVGPPETVQTESFTPENNLPA